MTQFLDIEIEVIYFQLWVMQSTFSWKKSGSLQKTVDILLNILFVRIMMEWSKLSQEFQSIVQQSTINHGFNALIYKHLW
jgi:hypothetical protein